MDVFDVLGSTLAQFQTLWSEIGFSEEDQKQDVEAFQGSISNLCDKKVQDLQDEKSKLENEVAEGINEIKKYAAQLGEADVQLVRPLHKQLS